MSEHSTVCRSGGKTALAVASFGPIAGVLSLISVPALVSINYQGLLSDEALSVCGHLAEATMIIASIVSLFGCIISVAKLVKQRHTRDLMLPWVALALLNALVLPTYLVLR